MAAPSPQPSPSSDDDSDDERAAAAVRMPAVYVQALQDAMDHYDYTGWCDAACNDFMRFWLVTNRVSVDAAPKQRAADYVRFSRADDEATFIRRLAAMIVGNRVPDSAGVYRSLELKNQIGDSDEDAALRPLCSPLFLWLEHMAVLAEKEKPRARETLGLGAPAAAGYAGGAVDAGHINLLAAAAAMAAGQSAGAGGGTETVITPCAAPRSKARLRRSAARLRAPPGRTKTSAQNKNPFGAPY